MPNKRACTFISGKVCLLGSIKVRRQALPEINVLARLFGTLEYLGACVNLMFIQMITSFEISTVPCACVHFNIDRNLNQRA